jgi:predicted nucleic acid-binding Zn ribbon protein
MRKSNTQRLSDVMHDLIGVFNLEQKLSEARIMNAWDEILGKAFSEHTRRMYIKDRILFVQIDSAVVRNELIMMRERLVRSLNEKAGKKVIEQIILR